MFETLSAEDGKNKLDWENEVQGILVVHPWISL